MTLSFCTTAIASPGRCHAAIVSRTSLSMTASLSCANELAATKRTAMAMTKRRMRGILFGHAHRLGIPHPAHALLRESRSLRKAGARHALLRDAEAGRRRGDRCGVAAVLGGRDHVTLSVRTDDVGRLGAMARSAQCDRA